MANNMKVESRGGVLALPFAQKFTRFAVYL